MRTILLLSVLLLASVAWTQQPDVIVVEGTFTVEKNPSEGRAAAEFCDKVEDALNEARVPFTLATEKQVEEGILEGHKVAIFPYSANWTQLETSKLAEFIESGGKFIGFYTVPREIMTLLGVTGYTFRRQEYEGEFSEMRFAADRPAGFPASVHQISRNLHVCEAGEDAKIIAYWHDGEGKATGVPAIVLSDNGLYMAHVLHSGNAAEQSLFVLAAVGHFLPDIWQQAVEGVVASIPKTAEVESLEALARVAAGRPESERLMGEVNSAIEGAERLLADHEYEIALRRAKQGQQFAMQVVAANSGSRDGELRGAWHGGGTGRDWDAMMASMEQAGFNALFPMMCSGNVAYYPSDVLPQQGERDEMKLCLEAARRHNVELHVWRINWAMIGGPVERKQQFIDEGRTMVSVTGTAMTADPNTGSTVWMCPSHEGNRQIEKQAMLELVSKYHPHGIHFDYMRFPSRDYCYCDRCRAQFEERTGEKVANWPADCFAGGARFEDYKHFRKDLQTSLVREIAQEARQIDPNVMISLAARSALPGAPENDGQDWPTWCREGYLDFVCPMDYSGNSDERLAQWLDKQLGTLERRVPLYAGLGVTYRTDSLANPVRAAKQIKIARDAGADGFLMFSYNTVFEQIMDGVKLGATSKPVTVMPHHHLDIRLAAEMPGQPDYLPARVWPPGASLEGKLTVTTGENVTGLTARCDLQTTDGKIILKGETVRVSDKVWQFTASGRGESGQWHQWVVSGDATRADGTTRPFILRSQTWRIATADEIETYRSQASPPEFETKCVHVGVLVNGYGSQGILDALREEKGIEAKPLYRMTPEHLKACDVVIAPQRMPNNLAEYHDAVGALRNYVAAGGGLMVTHDAVGMRQHQAVFPALATGGSDRVATREAIIRAEHPIAAGIGVGTSFEHSYTDHIPVLMKADGASIVVGDGEGNAVVVAGAMGKGRYVANGMCTGLGEGDREVVPVGIEKTILVNAIIWLGGKG